MDNTRCLLGVDLGTSSVKAVVIDETGRLLNTRSREYVIHSLQPGRAEQYTQDWWNATVAAVREAVHALQHPVAALGLSGQMHGTVLVDEDDKSTAPAIIWADQRSVEEVEEFTSLVGNELLKKTAGTAPAAGFMGPTLLWLKHHEKKLIEKSRWCMLPKDFIRLRLTGECATEASDASSTALFDICRRTWSFDIIEKIGLPKNLFPPVLEPAQIAGKLRKEMADELGLPAGIPVVAGCADQVAQAVGNGLLDPGNGSVTVGSGGQIFIPIGKPVRNEGLNVHVFCHAPVDRWYIMGAILTAGLSLRWFRDLLQLTGEADAYDRLSELAGSVKPCAGGVLFLPYLAGERSPLMDPRARGCFIGLTLRHGAAHLARAIMEGVAFALRQVLDTIEALDVQVGRLLAAGNGLVSPVWRQIVADVLNRPLHLSHDSEQTGRGAAMVAGVGAGIYRDYAELLEIVPSKTEVTKPVSSNVKLYKEQYRRFRKIYPILKPMLHESSLKNMYGGN
jgi:xylulokinase